MQLGVAGGARPGGLTGWLLSRLRGAHAERPRLALLDRIALAPRQSLVLVEAEGRRFLVATSAEGGAAFYPLDEKRASPARLAATQVRPAARVSW